MPAPHFHLPDGTVASYEWGSYAIKLAAEVGQESDTVPRMMAGIMARSAFWEDGAQFRRGVAILHECVHCLQDLTTGVGLWDFFLGLERRPAVLRELRTASYSTKFGDPVPRDGGSLYDAWLDAGFVPQSQAAATRRQAHLRARLAGVPYLQLGELDVFAIDRLLEAEAVMQVHLTLEQLDAGRAQSRVMLENRSLWSALDMAELYQGVYHDVIGVCRGWAEADGAEVGRLTAVTGMVLTGLLIDISLAHPHEAFVAASGLDVLDYDPGLKFLVLLSAMAGLSLAEHEAFATAVKAWDVEEAERLLLARSAIPYAHSRVIYEDWLGHLERLQGDDRRIGLRLLALRGRLALPAAAMFKSAPTFIRFALPLIVLADGAYRITTTNPDYLLELLSLELVADIAREQAATRFSCSAFEGAPFVCSHAEFGVCPAQTARCREGITKAAEFPDDEQCAIRHWLSENWFGTFRKLFPD